MRGCCQGLGPPPFPGREEEEGAAGSETQQGHPGRWARTGPIFRVGDLAELLGPEACAVPEPHAPGPSGEGRATHRMARLSQAGWRHAGPDLNSFQAWQTFPERLDDYTCGIMTGICLELPPLYWRVSIPETQGKNVDPCLCFRVNECVAELNENQQRMVTCSENYHVHVQSSLLLTPDALDPGCLEVFASQKSTNFCLRKVKTRARLNCVCVWGGCLPKTGHSARGGHGRCLWLRQASYPRGHSALRVGQSSLLHRNKAGGWAFQTQA